MPKFKKVTINIPAEKIKAIKEFAKKCQPTNNYKDTHQNNASKVTKDIEVGKIGEMGVYISLTANHNREVTEVDLNVYDAKDKNWDSDLKVKEKNGGKLIGVAVKSQSSLSARMFGLSWTFQDSPSRRDKIFEKGDSYVYFVEVHDDVVNVDKSINCTIHGRNQIKNCVFKEPKSEKLKGLKKVVYAEDL
jgi:hypothetical protein